MKLKSTLLFVVSAILLLTTSCGNDDSKRDEFTQIAQSRSTQELLEDLYVGSDGDVEAMARILNCTPSSIERIRKGETEATAQFAERVVDVSVYYYLNKQSFSILREQLDPSWKWYNSFLHSIKHHPVLFWSITIVLFLGLAFAELVFVWPLLIELLLFLICWIISLFAQPKPMEDRYADTFNPIIEQVISYSPKTYSSNKSVKYTSTTDNTTTIMENTQPISTDSI